MTLQARRRGPLHAVEAFSENKNTVLDTRKMEAKQLYFGWWQRYNKTRIDEPCLVLWSKQLKRNILIRGNKMVGKLFGQILYGEDMDEDFVLESMLGEDSLEWFLANLKTMLEDNEDTYDYEPNFTLTGGGPHPTTPSLWFNGYELADILSTGE
tara:strand:- start:597 stop:1058 length:462 start_codon:yes stop_codon:yes gene_type:complete